MHIQADNSPRRANPSAQDLKLSGEKVLKTFEEKGEAIETFVALEQFLRKVRQSCEGCSKENLTVYSNNRLRIAVSKDGYIEVQTPSLHDYQQTVFSATSSEEFFKLLDSEGILLSEVVEAARKMTRE